MKVLHFLDSVNRGGAETIALDICRNAKNAGIDLTFITTKGGTLEKDFQNSGAEFIKLNRKLPIDPILINNLRKIIKEKKIEVVQGYQAVEGLHLYLATIGLKNVKRVLSFQGGLVPDWKNKQTINFLIPRMNANIVVSEGLKKWHAKIDGFDTTKNFFVVYNCVDAKRVETGKAILNKELNLPDNALVLGMIGNFYQAKRKDQITICQALPKIFAQIPNAFCIFAGAIEKGAAAKFKECVDFCQANNIADKVFFLGGRTDIPDVLASLDLFVFSSFNEGLPIAAVESMFAKVPLIVSNIEPLLEVTQNGKYGEVFTLQNSAELAEKVIKLLENKELREQISEQSYEFAKENFSIEAHLRELKKIYTII